MKEKVLPRHFYERDTKTVARDILGHILVHDTVQGTLRGVIVEAEAYFGQSDLASHASRGMTKRNAVMFGDAGRAYIYLNYGMHYLLNVVTEKRGVAGAVLIRALEPVEGDELMFDNGKAKSRVELTNGPGKLTKAFGIDQKFNGKSLIESNLFIIEGRKDNFHIKAAPRIGISVAQDSLLRYYIEGNPFVSRK